MPYHLNYCHICEGFFSENEGLVELTFNDVPQMAVHYRCILQLIDSTKDERDKLVLLAVFEEAKARRLI